MSSRQLELGRAVPREIPWRHIVSVLKYTAALALLAVWFVGYRPSTLGGPAGYVMVAGTSMLPTLKTGDVVVVRRKTSYRVGDIVAYRIPKGQPAEGGRVIHRIVGGSAATGYIVRGDNRGSDDLWRPRNDDVIGKVTMRIPRAGIVSRLLHSPLVLGSLAAGLVFAFVVGSGDARADEKKP